MKLVHKDIRKIEKAMTKIAVYTAKSIGIVDPKIDFKFVMDQDVSADAIETAKTLKDLGVAVDIEKLKKYVKFDIFADAMPEGQVWTPEKQENE